VVPESMSSSSSKPTKAVRGRIVVLMVVSMSTAVVLLWRFAPYIARTSGGQSAVSGSSSALSAVPDGTNSSNLASSDSRQTSLPEMVSHGTSASAVYYDAQPVLLADRAAPANLASALQFAEVRVGERLSAIRLAPSSTLDRFEKLGLRPGDLLVEIEGQPIDRMSDGSNVLKEISRIQKISVTVVRNGMKLRLMLDTTTL
jgi:type II secretion system protein C